MTPAPLPQQSSYPVNLFSDFGVRCNTLSDLTIWKKRAQAGSGEAACHVGMAYVDGNGSVIDLGEAKAWFRLGADRGHRFCIFKLAEIEIEEVIQATQPISPALHRSLDRLCEMARLGVGEACVTLHFLLLEHGPTLENGGWSNPNAAEVAERFMHALDLAYKYRKGDSYQPLLAALLDLGKLGSGPAYHAAGEFCMGQGQKHLCLEYHDRGAKECQEKACVKAYLRYAEGQQRQDMVVWSAENCLVPETLMHLAGQNFPVDQDWGVELVRQAMNQCLKDDDVDEAVKMTRSMIENDFLQNELTRDFMRVFLLKLRRHGIEILDHHLTRILLEDGHRELLVGLFNKGREPGHGQVGAGGLNGNWYPSAEGSCHVGGFDKIAVSQERFAALEFQQIEEHGRLMIGCARGNEVALKAAMKSCMDQTVCNRRIKEKGLQIPPRILLMSYSYGRAAEIVGKEPIPQVRSAEQHPFLASKRDMIEKHLQQESERWKHNRERRAFVDFLGRAGRCSHRIVRDFEKGVEIRSGHFQPWRPLLSSEAEDDPVAMATQVELLSVCPITRDWILPAEDGYNFLASKECALLTDLVRQGEYTRAKQLFACEHTTISTSRFGDGIVYSFGRIAESAKLSVIAREMYFRGDYEQAEKIVDYLIFTEDLPQGRLHHISAWLKYKLGKLSDAITMLLDCPQAAQCEGLSSEDTDANVLEYRLLLAELLMRDERLHEANATILRLKADCEAKCIQDPRFIRIAETIANLNIEVSGTPMALMFELSLSPDRSTKISRAEHDHDLSNATLTLLTPLGPRGTPCNMDRFRCLFGEISQ